MSTNPDKPLSLNAISELLQKDSRRTSRALHLVEPDLVDRQGRKRWYMSTAERALWQYDRIPREFRGRSDHHIGTERAEEAAAELEAASDAERLSAEIETELAQLQALADPIERRRRSPVAARKIEIWSQALLDAAPADQRPFMRAHIGELTGRALQRLLDVCAWELDPIGG